MRDMPCASAHSCLALVMDAQLTESPGSRCRSFLKGNTEAGFQTFRTTAQNYFGYDTAALSVGESNQGIVVRPAVHK